MRDATTNDRLRVSTDGTAGPYIIVPVKRLDEICNLLSTHNVQFSVDETAISINGEPEFAVIDLGRSGDANTVQRILDQAA